MLTSTVLLQIFHCSSEHHSEDGLSAQEVTRTSNKSYNAADTEEISSTLIIDYPRVCPFRTNSRIFSNRMKTVLEGVSGLKWDSSLKCHNSNLLPAELDFKKKAGNNEIASNDIAQKMVITSKAHNPKILKSLLIKKTPGNNEICSELKSCLKTL